MSNIHRKGSGGFTLVEVAIIILTLAILSAILVPQLGRFNALARFIKVKEDLMVICTAMKMYLDDTGESAFYDDGSAAGNGTPTRTGDNQVIGLLIGDGDTPDGDSTTTSEDNWLVADTGTVIEAPEQDSAASGNITFEVDTFDNQLIENDPNNSGNRYRVAKDMDSGSNGQLFDPAAGQAFNSLFAWRGPYINDRVYPDPWGNRYASNVFALHQPAQAGDDGFASAVVCYSAGPDEQADTAFNQPHGWVTGDDDQTVILHAGGW